MHSNTEFDKYLSDPLNLPLPFKSWLVSWLQDNLVSFPASNLVGATFIPTSMVLDFAGATVPGGFLFCDGSQYPQGQYSALFAQVGTKYNTGGETAGYFRVPDCQGRLSVCLNSSVTALDTLGKTDGFALSVRQPFHFHVKPSITGTPSITDPGHNHAISPDVDVFNHAASTGTTGAAAGDRNLIDLTLTQGGTTGITAGLGSLALSGNIGVTSAGQDTPAFIVLQKIIKY